MQRFIGRWSGNTRRMRDSFRLACDRFWFSPQPPFNLAVARVLVAVCALWIVLSRFDLPSVVDFPGAFWETVLPERRIRFFFLFSTRTERVLWWLLHGTLIATIAGLATRWSALVSGLLLYHFGALEAVLWTGNPYLRGYTIPALALLIIGTSASAGEFSPRTMSQEPRWQNRWPLALIQVLFVEIYFFAGWSKIATSGLGWFAGSNMRAYILGLDQYVGSSHKPLNLFVAQHALIASAIAVCGVMFELIFPLVLLSRRARAILVPMAAAFHIVNGFLFQIWFQNAWLLLLFVNWDALRRRRHTIDPV